MPLCCQDVSGRDIRPPQLYMERPNLRPLLCEPLLPPFVFAGAWLRRLLLVFVPVPRPDDGRAPLPMLLPLPDDGRAPLPMSLLLPDDGRVLLPPWELCPQSPGLPGRFGLTLSPGRLLPGTPGRLWLEFPGRPYSGRWGGRLPPLW